MKKIKNIIFVFILILILGLVYKVKIRDANLNKNKSENYQDRQIDQTDKTLNKTGEENLNAGLVYGAGISYSLIAPYGWILDNISGKNKGLPVVFYPKNQNWNTASTSMYSIPISLNNQNVSFKQFIKDDSEVFKEKSIDMNITDGSNLNTKDGSIAIVKYFYTKSLNSYEATAYINGHDKASVVIVLSSKTQKSLEDNLDSFKKLVNSYVFVSEGVKIVK